MRPPPGRRCTACVAEGLRTYASFGHEGERPTACRRHARDGMVLRTVRTCERCDKQAYWARPGDPRPRPARCGRHKEDGMEDVVSRRCPGPPGGDGCPAGLFVSARRYCLACDPDDARRLPSKRAQARFFGALGRAAGLPPVHQEVCADYGCLTAADRATRAFVDGVIYAPGITILLELDEHAHCQYDAACEVRREADVTAVLRTTGTTGPIAWVRVNPDDGDWGTRTSPRTERARHREAVALVRDLLTRPRDGVFHVGYPPERIERLLTACHDHANEDIMRQKS